MGPGSGMGFGQGLREVGQNVAQGWGNWVQQPENRSALIQAGIQLLQPVSPGQSTLGAIGAAIGQGAAAKDRSMQGQMEQEALAKSQALDERRVRATETSAQASLARAGSGGAGASGLTPYQQQQLALRKNTMFQKYVADRQEAADYSGGGSIDLQNPEEIARLQAEFEQIYQAGGGIGGGPGLGLAEAVGGGKLVSLHSTLIL